jgi:tRNA threonylcarbamoyladenosine biosynthesis protein TsaB
LNILAIDTATPILSAALGIGEKTICTEAGEGHHHSETLMEIIESLLKQAGLNRENIEAAACMKGPGSFTGLRIAYAAAKGFALSLGIPLGAVPTLDCMAFPFSDRPALVLPVIDAKKKCFFTALYRRNERISAYLDVELSVLSQKIEDCLTNENEKALIITGPDAEMVYSGLLSLPFFAEKWTGVMTLDPLCRKGWAKELLEIAKKRSIFNNYNNELFSGPEYIRKSDAELKKIL